MVKADKKSSLESQVAGTVNSIRDLIAMDDQSPNYFNFRIEAEGRVRDGEVKITFKIGESSYTNVVSGDSVEAVLTEYLRRINWQKAHDYLALPRVDTTSTVETTQ